MTSSTLLFAKVAASATGVAVVGGTSYVVVNNTPSLQKYFVRSNNNADTASETTETTIPEETAKPNTPANTTDPLPSETIVPPETSSTVQKDTTPALVAPDKQDQGDFVYFIGKYTPGQSGTAISVDLYSAGNTTKQYLCQFEKTDNSVVQNSTCVIYKLDDTNTHKSLIDLKDTVATPNNTEIKDKSGLTDNENYLLKISGNFATALTSSSIGSIKVLTTLDETNKTFGTFTQLVDLSKDKQKVNATEAQSNLFSVLLTENSSESTFEENHTYTCKIGSDQTGISCKVYKLSKTYASVDKSVLDGSVGKITQTTDLAKDNYVLVDLESVHKTLAELDGKVVIVKTTGDTTVATGLAEQLLVGSVNAADSNQNNLFIVHDAYPTLTAGTVTGTEKDYILTKGANLFTLPNSPTYASGSFACRVIKDTTKYDDPNCKIYVFPKASTNAFVLANYQSSGSSGSSTEITTHAELGSDKYQIVELHKTLNEQLTEPNASLHIVQKDRAVKTINNKLVTLTKELDVVKGTAEATQLKTNLFLVRYRESAPNSESIDANTPLSCSLGTESNSIPCKIYKFSAPKKDNTFTSEEIKGLTDPTNTSDFAANTYFVIELTNERKGLTDLQNKVITLKKGETLLGKFDYDQVIFGKAKAVGLPIPSTKETYIVKKSAT